MTQRKGGLGVHQQTGHLWDLAEFPDILAEFLLELGWAAYPVQFPPGTSSYHNLDLPQPFFGAKKDSLKHSAS